MGCAVAYGMATGADLNVLFSDLGDQVMPVLEEIFRGILKFFQGALKK